MARALLESLAASESRATVVGSKSETSADETFSTAPLSRSVIVMPALYSGITDPGTTFDISR